MLSSVGLELMNSTNSELSWNTVTKGRRSRKCRKSIAGSLNTVAKVGSSISPKRVGDFSESDSDKFGVVVLGQLSTSGKSESVPIKKRRHLLQSPVLQSRKAAVRFGEGFDNFFGDRSEYNNAGDFSGIELLAAAASMDDDDAGNVNKVDPVVEESAKPKNSDASSSATQSKLGLESNTNCSLVLNNSSADSRSLCESPKVSRKHWDLNTLMDAWEEPYDDSISENASKNVNDEMIRPSDTRDDLTNPKIQENKSTTVSLDRVCSELPSLKEQHLLETRNSSYSYAAMETFDQAAEKDADEKSVIKTVHDTVTVVAHDEDCSSNVSECGITTASDGIQIRARDVIVHDLPSSELSESAMDLQQKDTKVIQKSLELHGTYMQDCQPYPIVDSNIQNHCQELSGPAEHIVKDEDNDKNGSNRIMVQDRAHVVVGDEMTRFPEGYDSPYEDGELRGSFLYPWEDNELENEYVDYESDGRNEDSSDAPDYPGSDIVEGGSEGSHGTARFPEGKSMSGPKHTLRRHFPKDDSDNNEIAGKVSNAGSGTTVEQSLEMVIEENYDGVKRRQLADRRNAFDVKVTEVDEYASKTARAKLQTLTEATDGNDFVIRQFRPRNPGGSYSRFERDITPERYQGKYRAAARGERDGVRHFTSWGTRKRYTSNYHGDDGHNHPPTRPRSKTRDSVDKVGGLDFHDPPRQNGNYMSKGLHSRPFIKRSPPVERDEYFGRMHPTRGRSNYRGRGRYSQRSGRDYADDFASLPDDVSYLSRREHSFSPPRGGGHVTVPRRRSRSRSRTRSPDFRVERNRVPFSNRGRILGGNRRNNGSRSPDFRMERNRVPFSKPNFASKDYGEGGYISPPPSRGGRFSPQRNSRWDNNNNNYNDRTFSDNHTRRRRSSPFRDFRRTPQRFVDGVGPSGRLTRDEYFNNKQMVRPRRFSYVGNGGGRGGFKSESNYGGGRRRDNDSGEMMHRGEEGSNGNNVRWFRKNAAAAASDDGFERKNLDDEDDDRVAELTQQKQDDSKDGRRCEDSGDVRWFRFRKNAEAVDGGFETKNLDNGDDVRVAELTQQKQDDSKGEKIAV